jgi:hypothetical protein
MRHRIAGRRAESLSRYPSALSKLESSRQGPSKKKSISRLTVKIEEFGGYHHSENTRSRLENESVIPSLVIVCRRNACTG